MLQTTARDIAALTGGALVGGATGDETVSGVARIDSREVGDGDLFAAFLGEHADGHDFLAAARAAGAPLALVTEDRGVPAVQVPDVREALSVLATAQLDRGRRENPGLVVLAVTGSAGKTGTKDLLGTVLATAGPVIAPAGSLNNELGLPLTVLGLTDATRFLVLEMGARGVGHIAQLTAIARPDISLVLNVGSAHLGEFGGIEATARAKGELVEALAADGRALLNAEDRLVLGMAERSAAPVLTWGFSAGDVRGTELSLDERARVSFTLEVPEGLASLHGAPIAPGRYAVRPDLLGEHQAANVLAALAAALVAGVDPAAATAALDGARIASGQRMQVLEAGGALVIDDAYNANPDSMRQALKTLAHLGRGHRTIAVLGEMLELGEDTVRLHDEIGRLAVRLNISQLYVVGDGAAPIHHGASLEGSFGGESEYLDTVEEAIAVLERTVRPGDAVLLKSSRDAGLRRIAGPLIEHLAERRETEDTTPTGADQ
ncbi:UDP-N-acetylmuramoyl-tripeptide--D-alanyl-D-alanine ligase [Brachybacterium saurashtrense]|uniref:UDP-N-acetylmuramoyl-tripeptide--D-alanyl-D-alanine ligase n=1 Tax=Brachybacterium saurashtrense TaxID=556288 RepID=A0A345YL30_9MICO|nr:UDP-N-acetylmuramoyl-tripeptide--D-alanyl-D-alanine ligase [Brachybacterium saurashtrense]AXK44632.1 UDP-N-acetylmuramoyl-tripeptide--D-alanyl-D-alanine ligase [Brachybacterium saurashtrense]RRR23244.1 UDP-N-acetylmuramoyl-tripeptide--D-alanyl-D-alanine ligase [Brachybacterium saurashtrense]